MYNKCVNRSTPRSVAAAAFSRTTGVNGRQSGTRLCGSRHSGTMVPSVPYGSRKRRPALLFENLFTLFRCSHHRKILCYVRMETARVPTRAVFTLYENVCSGNRLPRARGHILLHIRQPRHSTALTRLSNKGRSGTAPPFAACLTFSVRLFVLLCVAFLPFARLFSAPLPLAIPFSAEP